MALPTESVADAETRRSHGLLTDHYELTMIDAARQSGVAEHRAVFEVFARRLPPGRRYGVVGGVGRFLDELGKFTFDGGALDWLADHGVVSADTLDWLADYAFTGDIVGYHEGELFFPYSPVLTIEAPFAVGLALETFALSILNHDSAIAAAAARMVAASGGRPLIEAGSRRTHEIAAPAAARAAYVAGFATTSNLEAGRRWGVPTGGTTGHAFTLAHLDERAAFRAQLDAFGPASTFLVDTYDIETGIRNAVEIVGSDLGGIRIDSGDLWEEAHRARRLLDKLGATRTKITVSSDLNEFRIAELATAPVDRMLAGTELVTGSEAPTAGMVYKLVAIADQPGADAPMRMVAKDSAAKATRGGRKYATRQLDQNGYAERELVTRSPVDPSPLHRLVQNDMVRNGDVICDVGVEAARAHHVRARAELAPEALELDPGDSAIDPDFG